MYLFQQKTALKRARYVCCATAWRFLWWFLPECGENPWNFDINKQRNTTRWYDFVDGWLCSRRNTNISGIYEYGQIVLTHWGWMTHICVYKLTIIGSDNGLSPGRRQPIIWTNVGILLTHCGPLDLWKWTIFNTILTSPKSWLSQEELDVGCEHSLVPMGS